MGVLRVVLGDQLSPDLSALDGLDPAADVVLLAEVTGECTYVRHHKQKIVLVLSAMRHFAAGAARRAGCGWTMCGSMTRRIRGSLAGEVARAVARHRPERHRRHRARRMARAGGHARLAGGDRPARRYPRRHPLPLHLGRFARWAQGRRQLRMEYFYREMRRATGLLMDGDDPPAASGTSMPTTASRLAPRAWPRRRPAASRPMRPRAR